MPLLNVKLLEGVFTPKEKQEVIRKLTDTIVSIKGENIRPLTTVLVEEVKSGDWGVGGVPYSTADAKAVLSGSAKG
jgi:4-oxalocrotonate tautomerase